MDGMLHIDGRALNRDLRGLWRLILDHTGCERSTARILLELSDAREGGPIDFCVIFRASPEEVVPDQDAVPWRVRVTLGREAAPATRALQPNAEPDRQAVVAV